MEFIIFIYFNFFNISLFLVIESNQLRVVKKILIFLQILKKKSKMLKKMQIILYKICILKIKESNYLKKENL